MKHNFFNMFAASAQYIRTWSSYVSHIFATP